MDIDKKQLKKIMKECEKNGDRNAMDWITKVISYEQYRYNFDKYWDEWGRCANLLDKLRKK